MHNNIEVNNYNMRAYKRGTSLYDYCISENKQWILEQFDSEKNAPLTPHDFTKSSDKKAWFKFNECGHSCYQRIADKTGKDSKHCPHCLNRGKIGKSLLSQYPDFAQMFLSEANNITPDLVSHQSGRIFLWKCLRCGNIFQGRVSDVVKGKRVCNECSNMKRSFPEICLAYYLLQVDKSREIDKHIDGYKFDFYLPKYKSLVEYDGYPWHNTKAARKNDVIKDLICKKHNLTLLRIRDNRLADNPMLLSHVWIFDYDENFVFLQELGQKLSALLNINDLKLDVNVNRDFSKIKKFEFDLGKETSLLYYIPNIYDYIDPENDKNGKPEYIFSKSHSIRFWLRHPIHKNLKWSMTTHHLFVNKEPYTQWIKMCLKMLKRYPELEEQICHYGNNIREESIFKLTCSCGKIFEKSYASLMGKSRVKMCNDCLTKFRLNNLRTSRKPN